MIRTICLLLMAALLLMVGIPGCGGGGDDSNTGPLTQLNPEDYVPDVQVQVVDHNWRVSGQTDDVKDYDPIYSIISAATSTLDIAVTRINRQEIVDALINEAASGTIIRIITEKAYYDSDVYKAFYNQLEDVTRTNGNIEIRTDDEGMPRMMHSRFLILDHARVVTGSYPWEATAAESTMGTVISILNTGVAEAFTSQFNQMFVERNFGPNKRDDSQHSFLLGSGNGTLEVYFGPTDRPRDLLQDEVQESANVFFAIQQFKDYPLANTMLAWIQANTEFRMFGVINDHGDLGDAEENAVWNAFYDYTRGSDGDGGTMYISDMIDPNGQLNDYNTLNHKLLLADHALGDARPSVTFTTGNYSELGFTLNDEVILVFRGVPMVNKFWRGLDLTSSMPPETLRKPDDVKEFDQLFAMYPHFISVTAEELIRGFNDVPCGIIFGEVSNFRRTITVQGDTANDLTEVDIDLNFSVEGDLFFGGSFSRTAPFGGEDANHFVENELVNPNHRYMIVVPAGTITLTTTVVTEDEVPANMFPPDEKTFEIGPGCVKQINLKINQATDSGGTTTGTSGV